MALSADPEYRDPHIDPYLDPLSRESNLADDDGSTKCFIPGLGTRGRRKSLLRHVGHVISIEGDKGQGVLSLGKRDTERKGHCFYTVRPRLSEQLGTH